MVSAGIFAQIGKGILFLDEINMAPPTMQGMAQQLILDRRGPNGGLRFGI